MKFLQRFNDPKLDRRRLLGLFRPYRAKIAAVLALITLSAGLGMISPFLLRGVLDTAIPDRNTGLLIALVVGMIGIAIATGASYGLSGLMGVPYTFDPTINLLALVFSAAIGVVFGYFPARRAAQMDPIEALRHE